MVGAAAADSALTGDQVAVAAVPAVSLYGALASRALANAIDHLVVGYDPQVGLIPETPDSATYWLFSDNFLAALALSQYGKDDAVMLGLAAKLSTSVTADSHGVGSQNQYQALVSGPCEVHPTTNYNVSSIFGDQIKTTLDNGTGYLSPSKYADVAFLESVCFDRQGNATRAMEEYNVGKAMFDGIGLRDAPFSATGQYQTYKLALYIYSSTVLGQPVDERALLTLLTLQAQSGGFYTGYSPDYSTGATLTNTETTSLVALALYGYLEDRSTDISDPPATISLSDPC